MNNAEKAECREIAREIVKEVLMVHITTCPHHQAFLVSKARLLGIMIGVIVASGVSSATAVTILMKVFAL